MIDSKPGNWISPFHRLCMVEPQRALVHVRENPESIREIYDDGSRVMHWMAASIAPDTERCLAELLDLDDQLQVARDNSGALPIHWAARWGSLQNLVFLARQVTLELPLLDGMGRDLIHWHAMYAQDPFAGSQKLEFLTSRMATRLDSRDGVHGGTPLHWAAALDGDVRTFAERMPDLVNERDHHGATPLHWLAATGKGLAANLPLLLAAGAATDATTNDGMIIEELIRTDQREIWVNHLTGTRPSQPPI